jgi:hypothetical protein
MHMLVHVIWHLCCNNPRGGTYVHVYAGGVAFFFPATVGCGTGILSMFAAQAGAKHVYGIDMSVLCVCVCVCVCGVYVYIDLD